MNLARLLQRTAQVMPDRPAVLHGPQLLLSYRQLAARAASIAAYLRRRVSLQPGDRVAVFLPNCPEYLEVLYGIWWAGLVAVPVNYKLHPNELKFILADSGARAAFLAEGVAGIAGDQLAAAQVFVPGRIAYRAMLSAEPLALQPRTPDDLAWLFYTSGTTGRPKGVMLTHRNLLLMTAGYLAEVDEVALDDAIVYAAPMSHGAGLYNFAHVLKGARHVVPESQGFEAAELAGLSRSVGRLSLFAAPTMVRRLTSHLAASGENPVGFKTLVYGGGPMYLEDIKQALTVMGNRLVQIYGQGESPMTITVLSRAQLADATHPRWIERIASVGIANAMVEVRVADDQGRSLPDGEIGEVLVRGDTVMAGYWNNPAATAETIRHGWLATGDLGCLDGDGFLTLKDRCRDVIVSGGSNVYPREVEEVLLTHPGVAEVAVVGRKDAEWGEVVVAFVVGANASPAELDALCLSQIARFKRPKEYRFLPSLPKNNYGKVLKTTLRELL